MSEQYQKQKLIWREYGYQKAKQEFLKDEINLLEVLENFYKLDDKNSTDTCLIRIRYELKELKSKLKEAEK